MDQTEQRLFRLFFPYAASRLQQVQSNLDRFRFSYYTSASTGMKLLDKNEAWLRNAAFMNDFSEVHHGQSCLNYAWKNTEAAELLRALLTLIEPRAVSHFVQEFDADQFSRTKNSYLLCISEHGDAVQDEDRFGRLSMWRAYGGKTNVAFVFKPNVFSGESDAFGIYTSPVLYANESQFAEHFRVFVDGLLADREFLISEGWETVKRFLHAALRAAVLSTKHPGFLEEREWRLIYSPDTDGKKRVIPDIVDLDGIPQRIYKVPFEDHPEDGLLGATIPDLLDRIIVGPTKHPYEIRQAFVEKLSQLGLADASERVIVSGIPLRRT